jgi:tRNA nucleotidyltransferase (CCA-adding enzyme)
MTDPAGAPLTIITTHLNADYDAMASMLAAQKLYPEARVVFPGSQEKGLRNFFVQSMVYLFNMVDIKEVDFDAVGRLVLVDTKQPGRIGRLSELLDRPDLEVHIYDHHPAQPDDIHGIYEVVELTGATVSIMTQIIREKGIPISPDEATVMCLGIYEDTGSFTFSSTTEKDFNAAGFLVARGADLRIISNMISREITPEQLELLNDLFQAATRYNIKGVEVVVSTVTTDRYVPDFAFLVHKMVKMEDLNAVFALARMENKIYLVARSRTSDVDAGAIARALGGGGHPYAASASIKERTLAQTEQRLLEVLHVTLSSSKRARDLMSAPAISVAPDVSCEDARRLLTQYNVNALLVVEKEDKRDRLLGYITRQIIAKALYLKLKPRVRDYMMTEMGSVGPDAEISEIQEQIIENKQRVLPVVERDRVAGVITRTDLLNALVQQSRSSGRTVPDPYKEEINARTRSVKRFMDERIPGPLKAMLVTIGEVGARLGYGIYVVGGFVRDLFLYRPNEDIDIVVEGDGIAFAKTYARMMGARVHSHEKFGTAVVIFADGFKVDVASARLEHYRFPADLPSVEMSSIKLDLYRRDFTINTLAIQLNPESFGTLIDFFQAQKDIKEKVIRILHNLSFVEDPTRVYRAIRFEQRFGFTIGKLTAHLIKNVVEMDFFRKLSGRRVFTELRLIFEEENPAPAVQRLDDYGLLEILHPDIVLDKKRMALFHSVRKVLAWHDLLFLEEAYLRWAVYFTALVEGCSRVTTESICQKLELAPRHRIIFIRDRFEAMRTLHRIRRNGEMTNSDLYRTLAPIKTEMILFMMAAAKGERIKKAIAYYFTQLRSIELSVTGADLKKMGLEPGPLFREIFDAVLDAKLNGLVKTRDDELNFVRNYVS